MTTAQRNAIVNPAEGLQIFNTDTKCFNFFKNNGWFEWCGTCIPPAAPVAGSNGPLCSGSTLNLTASTIPFATYSWTGPNGFTSTAQNPVISNVSLANAGVYSVFAYLNCNSPLATVTVVVSTAPTSVNANASPNPVCAGSTLTLSGTATNATAWSWTGPNSFTSALQNPSITGITNAAAGVYTLTASNACGSALAVNTASVTVNNVPTNVSASAGPSPLCAGGTLGLTGSATNATAWSWAGPNSFSSALQSPSINNIITAGSGVYTLTASNTCGAATAANTASVTVVATPSTANAGSDINPACGTSITTLAANTPVYGTGAWSVITGPASVTTPGSPTSGVTGLAVPGTATLRWTISNAPCTASTDDMTITTTICVFVCGTSITVNHTAGAVAPITKTVTYGTVTGIPGETSKCWITSNLGATNQASSVSDATEAAGGWFWQFNRMQGYKNDGTPVPTWTITDIIETSDWLPANDPCTIELGSGWRIPTITEWTNIDAAGPWTDWNGPWNSALKLHAGGMTYNGLPGMLLYVGQKGRYWSSTDYGGGYPQWGRFYTFDSGAANVIGGIKAYGLHLRCIR